MRDCKNDLFDRGIGPSTFSAHKKTGSPFGNPAVSLRPVAFRPCLTAGLALSRICLIPYNRDGDVVYRYKYLFWGVIVKKVEKWGGIPDYRVNASLMPKSIMMDPVSPSKVR